MNGRFAKGISRLNELHLYRHDASIRPIGRVIATERNPSTPHAFHFRASDDAAVGIGSIVRVDSRTSAAGVTTRIYASITEAFSFGSASESTPESTSEPEAELRHYTAQVLRHVPPEPLQPVPVGDVFLADDRDLSIALRMEGYTEGERSSGIPVGLYGSGGAQSAVYLDADFLVGPEAAHLNISGVSGLATKTSAIEWMLQSVFAHFPAHRGSIAAVCFNVKGPDLLFLDQPGEISESDKLIYEALDVPAEPFGDVRYFAPYTARGTSLNTLRTNEALADSVEPLTWGISEVLQYADVLLDRDDVDAKADALIDFIRDRVVGKDFDEKGFRQQHRVASFADLDAWFRDVLHKVENSSGDIWRTHHAATIRKVRNRLSNLSTRCAGLVTDDGAVSDLPFGSFTDRTVYVVDVANLEEVAQDLVFARVISTLREHLERRDLGVDHVIVFADELNKYAPHDGPDSYVRKMLLDISERGRYLGLVLFGAQQFRSQVHRRVVGNAGTTMYGRMDGDELATPGYQTFSAPIKARLATLDKGQLMIRHPHFVQPVFIRFPRPSVMSGREGVERFPQAEELPLDIAVTRDLRRLDSGIDAGWVRSTIRMFDEHQVVAARNAVLRRRPDDVKAAFARELARQAPPAAIDAELSNQRPRSLRPIAIDEYGG